MEITNKTLKTIIILSVILLLLDYMYISMLSNHFKYQIYAVQRKPLKMNMTTAIMCYILIIFGLYYFIIKDSKPVTDAFILGIFVYGVYELVSISLLSEWQWKTVIIDTIWGGVLFSITTYLTRMLI